MHTCTSTYTQSYICQTCAYTNCQSYLNFTCTHILVKEYFPCIQTFVFVFGDVSFSCFLCYKYKKLFLILTPMVLPVLVYIQFYFIFFFRPGNFYNVYKLAGNSTSLECICYVQILLMSQGLRLV